MPVWLARAARVSEAAILERACLLALLSELGRGGLLCSDTSCWDDAVRAQRREQRLSCRLRRADHVIAVVNAVVGARHGVGGHLGERERARARQTREEKRRSGDLPIVAPLSWAGQASGSWTTTHDWALDMRRRRPLRHSRTASCQAACRHDAPEGCL